MAEILLSSEKFVKSVMNVSDNLDGKYILPALREAQEIGLKGVLGDCLLSRLKDLLSSGEIDDTQSVMYKRLVDSCQYFLAYTAIVEVTYKVAYKISNIGVAKTSDTNVTPATQDEIAKMQAYYQSKADACCMDLQHWLLDNHESFPELGDDTCGRIRSNLYSAASCGVWLGGPRGRRIIR